MRDLIFVDTETTGLDCDNDKLVEVSYAGLTGPVNTLFFGVEEVPEFIDNLIGFTKRGIAGKRSDGIEVWEYELVSKDATMVAANPSFDKGFLENNGLFNFHYRMLDIESYAMGILGLDAVPSMKEIQTILTDRGFKITEPDHTSRNDVLAMRDSYLALREISGK